MEKKLEKLPGKLKIREKLKVLFSMGTTEPIWLFFLMFLIVRIWLLGKEKMEKLPGKLENSQKTKRGFFVWDFCDR
jgi:hypothetical protein